MTTTMLTRIPDTASIIERARGGDLAAFNELVEQNQGLVYSVCWRLLHNRQGAEDATQETFIAVWRNIGKVRPDTFRPWLLTIAANASRSQLRRQRSHPAVSLELALEERSAEPPETRSGPEELALASDARRALEQALEQVPWPQREAMVLWHFGDLDYAEIARVTQTSIGTVKSRISRGRKLMGTLLRRGEAAPSGFPGPLAAGVVALSA